MSLQVWNSRIEKIYDRMDSQAVRNNVGSAIENDVQALLRVKMFDECLQRINHQWEFFDRVKDFENLEKYCTNNQYLSKQQQDNQDQLTKKNCSYWILYRKNSSFEESKSQIKSNLYDQSNYIIRLDDEVEEKKVREFLKEITNSELKLDEFELKQVKPITEEAKRTYKFKSIDDQSKVEERIDQRRHNFVKQFYFVSNPGQKTLKVVLVNVRDEFPTITLFQPITTSEVYPIEDKLFYTQEITTILMQLQQYQSAIDE